jgi:glucokinase
MSHFVIGGDVGGTNSRLALYSIPSSQLGLVEGRM